MFDEKYLSEAEEHQTLGPAYFDAQDVTNRFMKQFEDTQFKPMVDKLAKDFRERLWDDLQSWLLSDTQCNLQSEIWRMVDNCVQALLSGEQWAVTKYALADRYDCEKIRKVLAALVPAELQDRRIADLEKELAETKKDLEYYKKIHR